MYINSASRELNLKVVYYGPALSGKTTNLIEIHKRVRDENRSELICLKNNEDRTLYFDFMQLELGKVFGLTPKVQLYTVPGQVYYEASRKLVLKCADGVVFVADSESDRQNANMETWDQMHEHLAAHNLLDPCIPVIVQLNKRDLPSAVSYEQFHHGMQIDGKYPILEAVAAEGTGVLDTLRVIIGRVIQNLKQETQEVA